MRLEAGLKQRMEQRMTLLPQMLQSIEVLQLATVDLLALIDQELQQNEALEAEPPEQVESPEPEPDRGDSDPDDWRPADDGEDGKLAFLNNLPARGDSLQEFLRLQVAWLEVPEPLAGAVRVLIEHLDERGLLPVDAAGLADFFREDAGLYREALALLQSLEPRGVGAGSPIEAMLLQVTDDPDRELIRALLERHLDDLARNRLPDVARALGLEISEVRDLMDRIRCLNPRPASLFAEEAAESIRPDAVVALADGNLRVTVEDQDLPSLGINPDYAAMLQSPDTSREVRTYLRAKVRAARNLIDAVAQRRTTLARVVAAMMAHQQGFLEYGRSGIQPMRMADLADELGLHTSTVSRAIAGKYVQTGHGIFRLRDFFDGGRSSTTGTGSAQGTGRLAVQQAIAELIEAEDKREPLSDDSVVERLRERGIRVARRTVTKYRKELGIPSSWLRRRHGNEAR